MIVVGGEGIGEDHLPLTYTQSKAFGRQCHINVTPRVTTLKSVSTAILCSSRQLRQSALDVLPSFVLT